MLRLRSRTNSGARDGVRENITAKLHRHTNTLDDLQSRTNLAKRQEPIDVWICDALGASSASQPEIAAEGAGAPKRHRTSSSTKGFFVEEKQN